MLLEHLNGHLEGGLNKQSLTKLRRAKMKKMVNKETMELGTQEFTAQNTKLFTYAGSKLKFLKHFDALHASLGKKIKVKAYIESFAGTLSSLFHNLMHVEAEKYIVNDLNKRVINLYKHVKENPDQLFKKFEALENEFQRIIPEHLHNQSRILEVDRHEFKDNNDFYCEARELFNTIALDVNHAALFIFIMVHCVNGFYRENKNGDYNNGFNWSAKKVNTENLHATIHKLHTFFISHEVIFENVDAFELVKKYNERDTFIYIDPPYTDSSVQYLEGIKSFNTLETHEELLEICNRQFDYVMYSNNFDEKLCQYFQSHTSFERGKVNGTSKLPTKEILGIKCNLRAYTPMVELLEIDTSYMPINNNIDKSSLATDLLVV